MTRTNDVRRQALRQLEDFAVLMRNGHFDYGNGFHGRVYLNPHQLFRHPSTIWRLAQDLLDVLPGDLLEQTEVVAGPVVGGALLAHTLAGLLDGRRARTHPPSSNPPVTGFTSSDSVISPSASHVASCVAVTGSANTCSATFLPSALRCVRVTTRFASISNSISPRPFAIA